MSRPNLPRILAASTSAALVALTLLVGPASAGDSRAMVVGTDADGNGVPDTDMVLAPTPVTQGGATLIDVAVASNDNQTIANSLLYFPGFNRDTGNRDTLPTGMKIISVFGANADTCMPKPEDVIATPADSVVCDLGNIEAYGRRDVSFVVSVPKGFSPTATDLFSASVETNNENGSNNQIFSAYSGTTFTVGAAGDSFNTFIPPGQEKKSTPSTSPVGGSNHLQTNLEFQSFTDGDLVEITEGTTANATSPCPGHLICQPDYTTVSIDGGARTFTDPYLLWHLVALVPSSYNLNKAFVAHYKEAGDTNPDWTLFWKDEAAHCGSDPGAAIEANGGGCLYDVTLGPKDKDTGLAQLDLWVYSANNGRMRY